MAERITLYIGEPLASVLAGFDDNKSARVNAVADAYRVFVEDNTPALTAGEWLAIIDATNGTWIADMQGLRLLWATVSDAAEDGLSEKWGCDLEALSQRLRRMRTSELLAIREIIARFWAAQDGSQPDNGVLLRQCGANIREIASD